MRLKGKVALITGGNKSIGLAIARRYSEEGAVSILLARDENAGAKVVSEIKAAGGTVHFLRCDLTEFASLPGVVEKAVQLA